MAPKRRERELAAVAASGKRLQMAGAGGSSDPPSPRRLRRTVLVLLFVIRTNNKDRNVDSNASAPITRAEIRRIVAEQVRLCLQPIVSKLEGMEQGIHALTQTMLQDKAECSCPNRSNHVQFTQEAYQQRTSTEAEGLASNGADGNMRAQLHFLNELKTPIYHDDEIKSESDGSIKIGIFNGDNMIKSGPLAKVKVEFLALEGDFPYDAKNSWTAKEFNDHIARGRDGKGDVLTGEGTTAHLINGECDLGSIRFSEGSSRARKGKFVVGARVCGGQAVGVRVQEAVMKPVVVQVSRNKEHKKNHPPMLKDEVYRLEEIAKGGRYRKRLEENGIYTVQDFLKALNKDSDNLANILDISKEHKCWKKMTNHARECSLEGEHKLKSYSCTHKNVKLFFDCVHCLVGATFDNWYTPSEKFNLAQQALVDELKKHAHTELGDLPEDHVMPDNSPVPVHLDTYAGVGAGPSYMSSVTLANCSGIQVGGVDAVEGLINDMIQPSCVNVNNDLRTTTSIPNLQTLPNYQVRSIPNFSHAQTETFYANANPGPSSFTPDQLNILNHREQETLFPGQAQEKLSAILIGVAQGPFGGDSLSFGTTDMSNMCQLVSHEDGLAFHHQQAYTSNCIVPGTDQMEIQRQHICSQDNDTFIVSNSAHIDMTLTAEQLTIPYTPRSAQGSMQNQMHAPLPTTSIAVSEAPVSVQQALPPQQCFPWSGPC